jgi:hypothetical protein
VSAILAAIADQIRQTDDFDRPFLVLALACIVFGSLTIVTCGGLLTIDSVASHVVAPCSEHVEVEP